MRSLPSSVDDERAWVDATAEGNGARGHAIVNAHDQVSNSTPVTLTYMRR